MQTIDFIVANLSVIGQKTLEHVSMVGVAVLDDGMMAKLNAEVDVDKKTVEVVAGEFLKSQKLI